jgi:hypothetical protein
MGITQGPLLLLLLLLVVVVVVVMVLLVMMMVPPAVVTALSISWRATWPGLGRCPVSRRWCWCYPTLSHTKDSTGATRQSQACIY